MTMASLDKVCEWIENIDDVGKYIGGIFSGPCSVDFLCKKLSEDFRKAMEE